MRARSRGECVAVFGRKDYQQLKVIQRMTRDLLLPVEIVGLRTLRDADGLALSSRNAYLTPEERAQARAIPRALTAVTNAFGAGERRISALREVAFSELSASSLRLDYATFADADELAPLADDGLSGERLLFAVAGFMGRTRLIDNVVLGEDPPPIAS